MSVKSLIVSILLAFSVGGCATFPSVGNNESGGILALRVHKISTNGHSNQKITIFGKNPQRYKIPLHPGDRSSKKSKNLDRNWYVFSNPIKPGFYKINRFQVSGLVDGDISQNMKKDNDVNGSLSFEIRPGEITLLDRYFYMTWDNRWGWLPFDDKEYEIAKKLLAIEQLSKYWKTAMRVAGTSEKMSIPPAVKGHHRGLTFYDNGLVVDRNLDLMWADEDNGFDINFFSAGKYCKTYAKGGYTNWRLPTVTELYNLRIKMNYSENTSEIPIKLSASFVWTDEQHFGIIKDKPTGVSLINFENGNKVVFHPWNSVSNRVLPVRDM